ncbi:MAG: hypothetical protein WBM44_05930 [Waterburya sp.]
MLEQFHRDRTRIHLTYVSHRYLWTRHWCEAIDGEFSEKAGLFPAITHYKEQKP